jgi:mono/diheme cytochrome c family protein
MGRSPGMPPWGQELSEQQIADVVQYLRTVSSIRTVRP